MHSHPPVALAREVFARLCASLPPTAEDTPEARARRDDLAYAAVEAYYPVDAAEAELAVQIVAANAHALDSLRLAGLPGTTTDEVRRCRAQANSMMRTVQGTLRALERRQAKREKAEAEMHAAAMERTGYRLKPASPPEPEPEPVADLAAEADQYAIIYPQRAALIRRLRGLPNPCTFGPPSDELVTMIVTGTSPNLRALDAEARETVSQHADPSHFTTQ